MELDMELGQSLRTGERLNGYTKQGIKIVMNNYAVDPMWGTKEEELEKKKCIKAEMERISSLPRKEQHRAFTNLGENFLTFSQQQASYLALARVYTNDEIDFPGKVNDGGKFRIWMDEFRNAKASRARRRMVKRITERILAERHQTDPQENLVIASIACGSAMPVLEAVKELKDQGVRVNAKLLDFSGKALKYASNYAQELGVDDRIETIKGDVFKLNEILGDNVADEGEIVGITDYFNDIAVLRMLRRMWRLVKVGGKVICANVMPYNEDEEDKFLHTAINWQYMYRRDVSRLPALFILAGFLAENMVVHVDPYRTYCLVEAIKTHKTNFWGSIYGLMGR